jgi:hypothetical protein
MNYKKLNVPEFETIRSELEMFTIDGVLSKKRFWDVPYNDFKIPCPTLFNFMEQRKKLKIRICRFYLTPENNSLIPHLDGLTDARSPIGLNIPVIGYKGSTMDWYDCPKDNFKDGPFGFGGITASRIIDFTKIKKVESTVIDCPTFVRTDVVHGVENYKDSQRLVLSIRFIFNKNIGQKFEEAFDLEGIQ